VEKIVYLLWGTNEPGRGDALRQTLLSETAPRLLSAGVHGLGVNVHDTAAADAPSPMPAPEGEDPHMAEISLWTDSYDRARPLEAIVADLGLAYAGYLVVESLYEDYGTTPHASPRTWPDGDRSPGVLTVALIHRPPGLAYRDWIDRWHGTQSPLSAELQPRTRYVRNEVVRPLTDDPPDIDGIVEEAWPSAAHVADPLLFYNATTKEELSTNITRMLDSVNACLDLTRLRSSTMSEYLLKTLPT
jgi:EthD domain